jgi:hypothetical protein
MAEFNNMWASTLAEARPYGLVREEGCYITLDTATGNYGITAHTTGLLLPVDGRVFLSLPARPADIPSNPSPTGTAVYVVGWFHTHTPMTYAPPGGSREVGPSPADYTATTNSLVAVPGIAYDYLPVAFDNTPMSANRIPAGHPTNAPAILYPITPTIEGVLRERRRTL